MEGGGRGGKFFQLEGELGKEEAWRALEAWAKTGAKEIPPALREDMASELVVINLAELASSYGWSMSDLNALPLRDGVILMQWHRIKGRVREALERKAKASRPPRRKR
ncbi:MAG: hypothetical protein OXG15_02380 [Gammaproteobacteria bacterium]|nr:hypothetical protein [Gammaproteobacteria bacterium]